MFMIGDSSETLALVSISPIIIMYAPTIVMQWIMFGLIYLTVFREQTGLRGIGFKRPRLIDLFYAVAFLLVANLFLTFFALFLGWVGLPVAEELTLILPRTGLERFFWVVLSITAGIVEETVFRGYLITRLRMFGRSNSWILPIIIASVSFGTGHSYQGVGGFILLSVYGAMFSILFIKTKTLWPVIIAHFFQDFSALFYPYQQ